MTQRSIYHMEGFPSFRRRVVELNRLHNPEDPLHELLVLDGDAWRNYIGSADPDDDSPQGATIRARRDLNAIHKDFPYGAPLHEQAAYLVRAFGALNIFSEGNHRTGWDYAASVLEHHGHTLIAQEDDGRGLGVEMWDRIQETYPSGFHRKMLLDRDEVFGYLTEWFKTRVG